MADQKVRSLLGLLDRTSRTDWQGLARALSGPGEQLGQSERSSMEQLTGHDLEIVRLHTGAHVERLARHLNADAFSIGSDVFMPAETAQSAQCRAGLLAHELTHAVQQTRPRPLAVQPGGASLPAATTVPVVQLEAADLGGGGGGAEAEAEATELAARQVGPRPLAADSEIDIDALAERVHRLMRDDVLLDAERQARAWR